jgi:hypothetical protein
MNRMLTCVIKYSPCCSSSAAPVRVVLLKPVWRSWVTCRFHRKKINADRSWRYEKEIGDIFGRYFDGIAIRHCDWGIGNRYLNLVAESIPFTGLEYAMRYVPSFPMSGRSDDHHGEKGRDLRKKKMVVSWAYAASYSKPISVPQSLILQMHVLGWM